MKNRQAVSKPRIGQNPNLVRTVILAGLAVFTDAIGGTNGVMIVPPNPTPSDPIFVTVYGVSADGCVPRAEEAKASLSGHELHIGFPELPPMTVCTTAITPYAATVRTQIRLPRGTYDVIVMEGNVEVWRSPFTVGDPLPSIAVASRRVACTNERTGKTVVIKDQSPSAGTLDDFRDCKAKGWRVLKSDQVRIQQTVKGTAQ
jgi:hypothetical protein